MESVNFGDTIANPTHPSGQATVNLHHEESVGSCSLPTPQSPGDRLSMRIGGDLWQLPFARPQIATLRVLPSEEFEVEDRTLLGTVYGNTFERVSAVAER
jgi:hypothetical protein